MRQTRTLRHCCEIVTERQSARVLPWRAARWRCTRLGRTRFTDWLCCPGRPKEKLDLPIRMLAADGSSSSLIDTQKPHTSSVHKFPLGAWNPQKVLKRRRLSVSCRFPASILYVKNSTCEQKGSDPRFSLPNPWLSAVFSNLHHESAKKNPPTTRQPWFPL